MTTTPTSPIKQRSLRSVFGRLLSLTKDNHLLVKGHPSTVSFSAAPGASNVCTLTIQVSDPYGEALAVPALFELWLSDANTGLGLTANGLTSELTASTGALMAILTTEKAWLIQTDATGKAVVSLTDTGKHATYPSVQLRGRPVNAVATVLASANYG